MTVYPPGGARSLPARGFMRITTLAFIVLFLASTGIRAQSHTIIALGHGDFSVNELDPSTGKILHTFKAVNQPHEAAVSPDGRTIYASVPQAGHVVILDAATFTQKGLIETPFFHGRTPRPAGARGRGGRAAGGGERGAGRGGAAAEGGGRAAAPQGVTAPDSSSPHGMGLNADGSKLYIGVEQADVPGVVVYDTRAGKVLKKVDLVLKGGHYLQVQPSTGKIYYPHRTDNRVIVLDGATDTIAKIIDVEGGPVGVDFAPNGEVWIHGDGANGVEGTVTVIDSRTDTLVRTIQTPGKGAGRMAVSRDGKWAASTHGTTKDVAIIDAVKKEVVATVPVDGGPGFPIFSPDGSKLYVMVSSTSDVAVIDLQTMKVVNRWKAGEDTFGGGLRLTAGGR
jgi:DNA-binding beta-propeller fold protein YncE